MCGDIRAEKMRVCDFAQSLQKKDVPHSYASQASKGSAGRVADCGGCLGKAKAFHEGNAPPSSSRRTPFQIAICTDMSRFDTSLHPTSDLTSAGLN